MDFYYLVWYGDVCVQKTELVGQLSTVGFTGAKIHMIQQAAYSLFS